MSQIKEGMSEGQIRDSGGSVGFGGEVKDQNGHIVWTPRGDLHIVNGSAQPKPAN